MTVEGWIVRDGLGLRIYEKEPFKSTYGFTGTYDDFYEEDVNKFYILDDNLFPDLTFENSPRKIKITISYEKDETSDN